MSRGRRWNGWQQGNERAWVWKRIGGVVVGSVARGGAGGLVNRRRGSPGIAEECHTSAWGSGGPGGLSCRWRRYAALCMDYSNRRARTKHRKWGGNKWKRAEKRAVSTRQKTLPKKQGPFQESARPCNDRREPLTTCNGWRAPSNSGKGQKERPHRFGPRSAG